MLLLKKVLILASLVFSRQIIVLMLGTRLNTPCHDLYHGAIDEVVIKQTGDSSLIGQLSVVTQYLPLSGRNTGGFVFNWGLEI